MKFSRFFIIVFFSFLFCAWFGLVVAYGQEEGGNAEVIELRDVNYVSADYGFGIALPTGYITFDYDDNGTWAVQLIGEMDQPTGQISAEELPDDVLDVAAFWQLMKERDAIMAQNITYEKVDSVAGTGAIQARIEDIQDGDYILVITWVFVKNGIGYTISAYPSVEGDPGAARDLSLDLAQQFRWMTADEIAEWESQEHPIDLPPGQDY